MNAMCKPPDGFRPRAATATHGGSAPAANRPSGAFWLVPVRIRLALSYQPFGGGSPGKRAAGAPTAAFIRAAGGAGGGPPSERKNAISFIETLYLSNFMKLD